MKLRRREREIVISGCTENDNSRKMAASGGKDILAASLAKISRDKILSEFPLHWHVWHKDSSSLEEELALNKVGISLYFVEETFGLTAMKTQAFTCFMQRDG